jgi:hypothetical protein
MKKLAYLLIVVLIVGSSVGAMFITENAGLVGAALAELKFEALPGNPKLVGAPPQFKVTKATMEFLQKLQKDGKIVEVQNDGALKIK